MHCPLWCQIWWHLAYRWCYSSIIIKFPLLSGHEFESLCLAQINIVLSLTILTQDLGILQIAWATITVWVLMQIQTKNIEQFFSVKITYWWLCSLSQACLFTPWVLFSLSLAHLIVTTRSSFFGNNSLFFSSTLFSSFCLPLAAFSINCCSFSSLTLLISIAVSTRSRTLRWSWRGLAGRWVIAAFATPHMISLPTMNQKRWMGEGRWYKGNDKGMCVYVVKGGIKGTERKMKERRREGGWKGNDARWGESRRKAANLLASWSFKWKEKESVDYQEKCSRRIFNSSKSPWHFHKLNIS